MAVQGTVFTKAGRSAPKLKLKTDAMGMKEHGGKMHGGGKAGSKTHVGPKSKGKY